ncbi:MAG TPA: DUF1810 domain-containing protein [Burkholderiaceae bacterium]|nr:DUF1810 domain-containing protein [Burkholderiaceae bacterium]
MRLALGEDPYRLRRFVDAQEGIYETALAELHEGRKRSHWMWFIFPQFVGLGASAMSELYAIGGLDEARAFLAHPVLGPRLRACCSALLGLQGRSAQEILGSPDDLKLQSSATLFGLVAEPDSVFRRVIDRYYGGRRDERTLELVASGVG